MAKFVVSPAARRDLLDIWTEIAEHDPAAADRLMDRFEDALAKLADFPRMGHFRPDLINLPVRFWTVGRFLIIYRSEAAPIQIVRVVSGYRDIARLFKER